MMHHMTVTIHKEALLAEKKRIETALAHIGRKTNIAGDWEAVPEDMNIPRADVNETADEMEEYETRIATAAVLEDQLAEITAALARIEGNTYGMCALCGNAIEEDRLSAHPAATTCKKHLNV